MIQFKLEFPLCQSDFMSLLQYKMLAGEEDELISTIEGVVTPGYPRTRHDPGNRPEVEDLVVLVENGCKEINSLLNTRARARAEEFALEWVLRNEREKRQDALEEAGDRKFEERRDRLAGSERFYD